MGEIRRININIHDGISDADALAHVAEVVRVGRISKARGREQYCFSTANRNTGISIWATTTPNGSDTFHVNKTKWNTGVSSKARAELEAA